MNHLEGGPLNGSLITFSLEYRIELNIEFQTKCLDIIPVCDVTGDLVQHLVYLKQILWYESEIGKTLIGEFSIF